MRRFWHSARARYALILAAACLASGCTNSPVSPSPTTELVVVRGAPIVLSGQSNALLLAPILSALYPLPVLTVGESGRSIAGWEDSPTGNLWRALIPLLQQPIAAFVWWQGESDRQNADYLINLRNLIARVRQTNGNPRLLVIVIGVLDRPQNASVRAAQEEFVRTDSNAILISSDGLGLEASDHLSRRRGYLAVARWILEAVGFQTS